MKNSKTFATVLRLRIQIRDSLRILSAVSSCLPAHGSASPAEAARSYLTPRTCHTKRDRTKLRRVPIGPSDKTACLTSANDKVWRLEVETVWKQLKGRIFNGMENPSPAKQARTPQSGIYMRPSGAGRPFQLPDAR